MTERKRVVHYTGQRRFDIRFLRWYMSPACNWTSSEFKIPKIEFDTSSDPKDTTCRNCIRTDKWREAALKYYISLDYPVEIEHESDGSWTAWHPELGKGACYATADTKQEALKALEVERRDYIEFLLKEGIEVREPNKQMEADNG